MTSCYAGIDIGGTAVKIGFVSLAGEILEKKQIPSDFNLSADDFQKQIAKELNYILKSFPDWKILGVGVGIAGQVNFSTGIFIEGPNLTGWSHVPVSQILQNELNVPVFIDNDANVAALGEYRSGAGRGTNNMMAVTLGTGVGGGLILEGKLYRGSNYSAGEFGHLRIKYDGRTCACGKKGCVEAYVGTQGILLTLQEKLQDGSDSILKKLEPAEWNPKIISEAASRSDSVAIDVLRTTGEYLGMGLASVANLLNLERVVVGGGVSKAGDLILGPAAKKTKSDALSVPGEHLTIVPATLGNDAGFIGAANLAQVSMQ